MKKDLKFFFENQFIEHKNVLEKTRLSISESFHDSLMICLEALKKKKKILFFGNGGSASDSQHLATELTVRFNSNRPAIAALALTTDSSTITAVGNDFGFEFLFSRQIEALGNPGDVAIGISTSGKSKNIIVGLKKAQEIGLKTICFTGKHTKNLKNICSSVISIPAKNTSRIQEMHIFIGQMLCNAIEKGLNLSDYVESEKF